jgi:hypothetical protein
MGGSGPVGFLLVGAGVGPGPGPGAGEWSSRPESAERVVLALGKAVVAARDTEMALPTVAPAVDGADRKGRAIPLEVGGADGRWGASGSGTFGASGSGWGRALA